LGTLWIIVPLELGEHLNDKKREQFALLLHLVKLRKILPVDIGNDFFYDEIKS